MRMWMVDPKIMSRQRLLGEHNEIHKHRHCFVKKHNMINRILLGQIEPSSMKTRHDELVQEMLNRNYNHKTPYEMPDISYLGDFLSLKIDREKVLREFLIREDSLKG